MSIVLTIIGLMLALDLLWWWRADRLLRPLRRARVWRTLLALFMAAQLVCLVWVIFGRFTGADPRGSAYASVVSATFIWHMLILLPTTLVWAGVSVLRGVARLARSARAPDDERSPPEDPDGGRQTSRGTGDWDRLLQQPALAGAGGTSRRQFLGAAAAAVPPLVTVIGTAVATRQLDEFRVRRIDLTIPDLPPDLDGLRIAHVSDVHVGSFTNGRLLHRIADASNALRPDLVLLTGDLINMNLADLPAGIDMVNRLDPKRGVFLCEGNHDLIESRRGFEARVRQAGLPLLINESTVVPVRGYDVQILGLRWGSGMAAATRAADRGDEAIAASFQQLRPQIRPDAFPILLAHHPHAFDPASAAGVPLTLSGHTHGGQLMLPGGVGFGPWMYRYWSGAYSKDGGRTNVVVSNGVGNWFPLRLNAPAEIIDLCLHRA